MTERFQNKYRIKSARLPHWDYGRNAAYFLTICTQNRQYFFGNVVGDNMILSDLGKIANNCWLEISKHFPFVRLENHVVMPNHVHGIVVIDKPETPNLGVSNKLDVPINETNQTNDERDQIETPNLGVSTNQTYAASKKWNSGSIGVIINQYKRAVTIRSRKIHADFSWQLRFHDDIIRNGESFQRISEYIINSPLKWNKDKFK